MEAKQKHFRAKAFYRSYMDEINWDWLFLRGMIIFACIFLAGLLIFCLWFFQ